jgi:hypothetical protein
MGREEDKESEGEGGRGRQRGWVERDSETKGGR